MRPSKRGDNRLDDQDVRIEEHRCHHMFFLKGMNVTLLQEHAADVASQCTP